MFRNVRIQWVGENQLGIMFFSPPDGDPAKKREPIRGWTYDADINQKLRVDVHYQQVAENDTALDRYGAASDLAAERPHSRRLPRCCIWLTALP